MPSRVAPAKNEAGKNKEWYNPLMLKERYSYLTFHDHNLSQTPLSEIVKLRQEREMGFIWSARLSTGLFGLSNCSAGNRGPIGNNEIILAAGDEGLQFLIRTGFIPCPSCHPEDVPRFFKAASKTILDSYGRELNPYSFADKTLIPFDSRRVHWDTLLPLIGDTPDRLYLPKGLGMVDLISLKERFEDIGFQLPPVGYYDRNAQGHFYQYTIPINS